MSNSVVVASVQMVSTPRVEDNLSRMQDWVAQAADAGAQVVLLPEYFCVMGTETDKVKIREPHGQGDRKSTRLNSSHIPLSRMPSSA